MKTTTTMIQMLGALGLLASGCAANEPGSHGSSGSLEACADTIREGGPCDFTTEVVCSDGADDVVCRCARSTDGGGRIVCERRLPPDPGGGGTGDPFCSDHVHSGDACDAAADVECRHACDPAILCRCLPADGTEPGSTTDPAVGRRVWVCGAPVPGGTTDTCTDWHVEACRDPMRDPAVSCIRGGAICRCGVSADGTVGLVCELPPPPPPGGRECTDAIIASCSDATIDRDPSSTVDDILCYRDGRACRCAPATATGERATVVCEDPRVPPLPAPDTCTEELLRICAAGMAAECTSADGRHCWCDPRSAGATGFICDVPPPPPGTGAVCTDADYARCAAGERVECAAPDGSLCRCASTTADMRPTLVCDGAVPPPPPPPGTGAVCTDADYARCAAGERVECAAPDGSYCRCASTTADMRPTLICG